MSDMTEQPPELRPIPDLPGLLKALAQVGFVPVKRYRVVVEVQDHWQFFMMYGRVRVECCVYEPAPYNEPHGLFTASVFKLNASGDMIAEAVNWSVEGWKITKFKVAQGLMFSNE